MKELFSSDFRLLKTIKVETPKWNSYDGYITYKKQKDSNGQWPINNLVDEYILLGFKNLFKVGEVSESYILFEEDLKELEIKYRNQTVINITITFIFSIPIDAVPLIKVPPRQETVFKLYSRIPESEYQENLRYFATSTIVNIPFEKVAIFIEQFKVVDFSE